ncbi:MAG: CHAT domain-containing protein [Gammaproteobacteria bacterium]|nr:CHAT domain-containing protein [Gammaproteobacteria bacterium]MDH5304602.1 CHAT domain-containing protein [Gammaproteobacteria bacterium]
MTLGTLLFVLIGLQADFERHADAAMLLQQAEDLRAARKCNEALAQYQAAELLLDGEGAALVWQLHFGRTSCLLTLGRYEDVSAALPELTQFAEADAARLTRTARLEAGMLHRQGRLQEAEQASLRAVQSALTGDDPVLEIDAYSMLATVYSLQGRNREATEIDERLLAMERTLSRGAKPIGLALNELAIDYRHLGRYDEGLALLREALALFRSIDDKDGQAMVLYNTAQVHADNGDDESAFAMLREALVYSEQLGHLYGLGLLHTGIGSMLAKAGNAALGRTHLEKSLELNRSATQAYGELQALQALGLLERSEKNYAQSQSLLETAVKLADDKGYGGVQAYARIELALTLAEAGNTARGLELLDEAQELGVAQDDFGVLFEAAAARAIVLELAGQNSAAGEYYLRAIDMLESWRGRMLFGDLLVSVPERYWHVYEGAIRVLSAEQRDWDAFVVSERARARMLLDVLANRKLGQESAPERSRLRAELMSVGAALVTASDARKPELASEAEALSNKLQSLDEALRQSQPTAAAVTYPLNVDLAALRAAALPSGVTLLAFFWGERDVYAWRIDAETVRLHRLGPAKPLQGQLDFLHAAITGAGVDWRPAAALAYRNLLAPVLEKPAGTLFVVADGPLLSLPLEVMLPAADGDPLGAMLPIAYVPSANVLAAMASRGPPAPATKSMLALGYSAQGEEGYAPLPHATNEASKVYALYRDEGARLLTGRNASLAAWIAAEPATYRLLHFAAHAIVDERRPEKSHLVFAESRLDLSTIRQLHFNAELVTLSACETAVGRHWRGEGMVGLAHAFLESGARALLASAWRVDDAHTAAFMRDFYAGLEAGRSPLASLVEVRRNWVRKAGADAHPGNWGGFVLIGWPTIM